MKIYECVCMRVCVCLRVCVCVCVYRGHVPPVWLSGYPFLRFRYLGHTLLRYIHRIILFLHYCIVLYILHTHIHTYTHAHTDRHTHVYTYIFLQHKFTVSLSFSFSLSLSLSLSLSHHAQMWRRIAYECTS
jgi:hypothetical protein